MANNTKVQFRPVQGTEEQILGFPQLDYGTVYYATDSGKMYVDDFATSSRVLIGGNTKIFYGHKKIDWEYVDTETTVFDFKGTEIESPFGVSGEHDSAIAFNPILPAVNDLILNEDGGFYKVIEIDSIYDVESATITAKKLTISGTGVGGGGGNGDGEDEATGEFKVTWNGTSALYTFSTLYGDPSTNVISFDLTSKDAFGNPIDAWYTIYVGPPNTPNQNMSQWPNAATTFAAEDGKTNHIDLLPILTAPGEAKKIRIVISNGVNNPVSKSFTVTATDVKASWNYNNATINDVNEPITFSWSVSGSSTIKKIITFNVGSYSKTFTNNETGITFVPSKEGFKHGVYSASLHVDVELTGGTKPANTINKNVMFVDYDDPQYANKSLVSINYFEQNITQYDTIKIPISIYVPGNTGSANIEVYKPNSEISIPIKNVKNGIEAEFLFTPDTAGAQKLTAYAGIDGEDSIIFDVQALNIDNAEVAGYALKFAANAFSGNDEVKSWAEQTFRTKKTEDGQTVNIPMATFSERFDWINGGLTPIEDLDDNGNPRQYFCIKAGSTMTLNYPLFEAVAQQRGKAVKIIFKATNCRDYDASVLSCKTPIKRVLVTPLETFLPALEGTDLTLYPNMIVNTDGELEFEGTSVTVAAFNSKVEDSWKACVDKYLKYNDEYYRGRELIDSSYVDEKGNAIPYFGWYPVSVEDTFIGLDLKAQSASYKNGANIGLTTQYCEDSYIELELDITKVDSTSESQGKPPKNYIKFWIDGIPSGFAIYGRNNSFSIGDIPITIGSADCDVYIYMIKVYEQALIDNEEEKKYDHLKNFIADAPNSAEMIARYNRNNIMDERTFSPTLIAQNNPNCLVHVYTLSDKGMTTTKKDLKEVTSYKQYHGSGIPVLQADDITIKVQGTSSESYVLAAANIDTDFGDKMRGMPTKDYPDGEPMPDGWSMDGGQAIPVNFFCTKVNVASCENANNALNQEWYNAFQPYQSVLRCKNPRARDTMQFTNGVIFMEDHNNQNGAFDLTKKGSNAKGNNLFAEIAGYKENPHPRFYSLGQMGNSKDNVHVCHDLENPLECCMEVRDNQEPEQWMVSDDYNKADAGQKEKLFEFRYPPKSSDSNHVNGWNRLVTWMSHSNPQAKYEEHQANNKKDFEAFSINYKTHQPVPVFILNEEDNVYEACERFIDGITTYYTETPSVYGHTNLPLPDYKLTEDYEPESFREYFLLSESGSYIPYNAMTQGFHYDEDGNNDTYEKVVKSFDVYTFRGFKTDLRDSNGQLWQKDYEPLIAGCTIDTYANTYTHDTYEYRMAKMISECENYLIMDSILYHYLFIERHCMIDNVAKNTFWSTEDCKHWNMIKDYDNDTADGNDNNGKFTRNYGMEPLDRLNANTMVFNAYRSVWLQFVDGLQTALEHMNTKLEEKTAIVNGRTVGIWNKDDYLAVFKEWQSRIPERCWIEDYRRKYFRPYELYSETLFLEMMEGGKKEHQRKQFETYQDTYMSSKYFGKKCEEDHALIRGNGQGVINYELPIKVYSDCYVYLRVGSETAGGAEVFDKNNIKKTRIKRNSEALLICPSNNLGNAVIKIHPLSAYQTIGNPATGQGIGAFEPDQLTVAGAPKLRELVITTLGGTPNQTLKNLNLSGNRLLEKLYACELHPTNTISGFPLNLNQCPSLKYVDGRSSFFDDISFADGAPIETILLEKPTALKLHNMYYLQTLHINDYQSLTQLDIIDIDSNSQLKDNNGALMSSQVLMNNAQQLANYKFNDVKWRLTERGSVNEDTEGAGSISILDKLLGLKPLELIEDDGTGNTHEAVRDALTGNLTISSIAYDGENAFGIYNKYVTNYPYLDIDFEDANSMLYEITIVDGDDKVIWKHKVNNSMTGLTTELLATGPLGAFNVEKIKKSPFQNWVYEHNGTWTIYDADTLKVLDNINTVIPTYTFVTDKTYKKNLLIKPNFTQKDRTYTLTFWDENGENVVTQTSVMAGAAFKTGYPLAIPSKDGSNLPEDKIYVFIGYGEFINNNSTINPEKPVNDNINLYPKFKEIVVYDMYNYANMEDYFSAIASSYIESDRLPNSIKDQTDSSYDIADGYILVLKVKVSGKLLIPSTWTDGKPVIGIYVNVDNNNIITKNGENLQYVFFEKINNNLRMYNQSAFSNMKNLKKVVNQPAKLRIISNNCFQECFNLETSIFDGSLISIGGHAFNQTYFNITDRITVILGSNIMYIGNYAFSNMDRTSMTFEIGEQTNKSKLDLTKCGEPPLFRNNPEGIAESLTWYTDKYSAETDEVIVNGETKTVKEYFPAVHAIYFNPQV